MSFLAIGLLGGLFILAVCNDVATREISDYIWMSFLIVALFFGYLFQWHSLLGVLLIYLFFFLLWKLGMLGGGDVKLITTSSVFFTPQDQLHYIFNISLAGGFLALCYLLARGRFPILFCGDRLFARIARIESWRIRRGRPLPYAIAIAAGFAITVLKTH